MSDRENEIDETTGVKTTGHEWDGIKELDNPMPRWWLWTFYATIVFAVGYMAYYPAIPLLEGSTMGISGSTNRSELKVAMAAATEANREKVVQLASVELTDIQKDENLTRFAVAGGKSLYKVYCSQCHGSGAAGGAGYPNLNDDDWIWGGDIAAIHATIKHGVRNDQNDDARDSQMPAFGADETLDRDQINAVTEYVLAISSQEHDKALATKGQPIFAENCSACHGENGKGNRELGAPNLTDAISLYGNTRKTIRAQIWQPQQGVMPPWQNRLSEAQIRQLAVYVHSLGGGEKAEAE